MCDVNIQMNLWLLRYKAFECLLEFHVSLHSVVSWFIENAEHYTKDTFYLVLILQALLLVEAQDM